MVDYFTLRAVSSCLLLWGLPPPPHPRESAGRFTPKSPNGENCQCDL